MTAGLEFFMEILIGNRYPLLGTLHLFCREDKSLSLLERDGAATKGADSDFRTLGV